MRPAAAGWLLAGAIAPAAACQLVLHEARSGRELLRAPLAEPAITLAFTHSVLGTPVLDRYAWRDGGWRLVEETYTGEGYGLPHAAGEGERLQRDGDGWRLVLDRPVQPLVVRPVSGMRLHAAGGPALPLAALSTQAIGIVADGCR